MARVRMLTMAAVLAAGMGVHTVEPAAASAAASTAGRAPQATGLPDGPDRDLVAARCGSCHGLDLLTAHRDTPEGWASVVDDMVVRGAAGSADEFARVARYLAEHFPKAAPGDAANAPASDAVRTPEAGTAAKTGVVTASAPDSPTRRPGADWPRHGGDAGGRRYAPLRQINTANVGRLQLAWRYDMLAAAAAAGADPGARPRQTQVTPLVVDGVLYVTNPYGGAAALEGDSGKVIWTRQLNAEQGLPGLRSLSYWPGDGETGPTLFFSTTAGYLIALDARTGAPVRGFGDDGALNLKSGMVEAFPDASYGMTSPPLIHGDILITGSRTQERPALGPSGAIRAWDARTGAPLWTFNTIPQPGEANHETWDGDSWRNRSGANNWGLMTLDAETDTVFIPLGTVTFDYYGGDRPGPNLYGDTLVALDARTGRLKWHYQTVHHDVWDYDLNAAPVLIDIKKDGGVIPAVALVTKQSLLFFLDRATGQPVHPVEERAVPQEGFADGEHPWPTQPHPVVTPPLARADFTRADIARITPEHTAFCEAMLTHGRADPPAPAGPGGFRTGPLYTPFDEGGSVLFPGTLGGVNWHGLSYDPELGLVFAATMSLGEVFQMIPDPDPAKMPSPLRYQFWDDERKWPCNAPPWGELVAVDVNTGGIAWRRPFGSYAALEALGVDDAGTPVMGGSISTAGGVTFAGGTLDNQFRAFASRTGEELWRVDVGAAAHAIPLSYLGRDGRQYVAVVVSGGGYMRDPIVPPVLHVYALPDPRGGPAAAAD